MTKIYVLFSLCMLVVRLQAQNIGINATGAAPDHSAMLDISATNRGLLVPRISLSSTSDASSILNPATSLLVWNTNPSIAGGTGTGYYYNAGTPAVPQWVRLVNDIDLSSVAGWQLSGNSGTSAATHFLGTTDQRSLAIRTNNKVRVTIDSLYGRVGIGTSLPVAALQVADSSVVFSGTNTIPASPANPPVIGPGRRMMWYPDKAAFRVGRVLGSHWDKDSVGIYSLASGYNTVASGTSSVAMGMNTNARSYAATVLGMYNDTSDTPGPVSAATDRLFQVGNGSAAAGSNAVTVLKNGNMSIGNFLTIPNESRLVVAAAANGNDEGGQIQLNAPANPAYNTAFFMDVYRDYFRIMSGSNAGSSASVVNITAAGNMGIGVLPVAGNRLQVNGKTQTTNFQMTNGAVNNYILSSDAAGNASWVDPATVISAGGTLDQAYDYGGAGAGRVIIADAGPVEISNGNLRISNAADNKSYDLAYDAGGDYFYIDEYGAGRRLAIKNGGNVGIGNLNPGYPLSFANSIGGKISLFQSGTNYYGIGIASNEMRIFTDQTASDITFGTGNATTMTERVRITGDGNVGIGTNAPSRALHINNGKIRIVDGSQVNNNFLACDANGVGTWKPIIIKSIYGTIGNAGVNIPYNTNNFLYTNCYIDLPPGRYSVVVNMLMTPQVVNPTTGGSPANSSFWLRSTFSESTSGTITSSGDIVGGTLASAGLVGPAKYITLTGTIIINNSSAGTKRYYYCAGQTEVYNTTQSIGGFGSNYWNENSIVATPIGN